MKTANIIFSFILLFIFVIILSYPRFNQQDILGIKKLSGHHEQYNIVRGYYLSGDAVDYLFCVKYYRDEIEKSEIRTPFAYRMLVPYFASFLPIGDALTSLNVMNVVLFCFSLILFYCTIRKLNFSSKHAVIGCYLLGLSFFTFYYLTIGLIESGFVFFYILGFYSIFKRNDFLFLIAITLGVLAKEFTLVLIPTFFIYNFIFKLFKPKRFLLYTLIFILPLAVIVLVRIQFNDLPAYIWTPELNLFLNNVFRIRAYIAPILVLGIPGFIGVIFVYLYLIKKYRMEYDNDIPVKEQLNYQKFFVAIFFFSILLWIYGFMSAVADGRTFMPSFITAIFMTLITIKYFQNRINMRESFNENSTVRTSISKSTINQNAILYAIEKKESNE